MRPRRSAADNYFIVEYYEHNGHRFNEAAAFCRG